ncbi:hypothetical protein HZC34_08340 [Candidatus Saganbacteria bacterium]|nr:hypothetical protein [Candidatus Saganbacteria bacterium]
MPKDYRHYEAFRDNKTIEEGGLLRLSGAFLKDHEDEILNLVKHEGRLAEQENPSHKLMNIDKANGKIVVTTSVHNLATHIGKALSHAYKGKHTFKFLKGEKYVEVDWSREV